MSPTETMIPCPMWCEYEPGHEYETESQAGEPQRHHQRDMLRVPAERFGDPYDVTVAVGSTETVTVGRDGVQVTATPPAIWFNSTNLRTLDELGFDIDPQQAMQLAESLSKTATLALWRSDPPS